MKLEVIITSINPSDSDNNPNFIYHQSPFILNINFLTSIYSRDEVQRKDEDKKKIFNKLLLIKQS